MISENEYQNIKQMITFLEKKRDQAEGALKQIEDTMEKEFKVKTLEEAEKLLNKLDRQRAEYEEKFREQFDAFQRKYGKRLKKLEQEAD